MKALTLDELNSNLKKFFDYIVKPQIDLKVEEFKENITEESEPEIIFPSRLNVAPADGTTTMYEPTLEADNNYLYFGIACPGGNPVPNATQMSFTGLYKTADCVNFTKMLGDTTGGNILERPYLFVRGENGDLLMSTHVYNKSTQTGDGAKPIYKVKNGQLETVLTNSVAAHFLIFKNSLYVYYPFGNLNPCFCKLNSELGIVERYSPVHIEKSSTSMWLNYYVTYCRMAVVHKVNGVERLYISSQNTNKYAEETGVYYTENPDSIALADGNRSNNFVKVSDEAIVYPKFFDNYFIYRHANEGLYFRRFRVDQGLFEEPAIKITSDPVALNCFYIYNDVVYYAYGKNIYKSSLKNVNPVQIATVSEGDVSALVYFKGHVVCVVSNITDTTNSGKASILKAIKVDD